VGLAATMGRGTHHASPFSTPLLPAAPTPTLLHSPEDPEALHLLCDEDPGCPGLEEGGGHHPQPLLVVTTILTTAAAGSKGCPSSPPHSPMSPSRGGHWLGKAITEVDDLLGRYPTISKIKTIGDVVMLAGPFEAEKSNSQTTSQTRGGADAHLHSIRDIATNPQDVQQTMVELVQVSQALRRVGGGLHTGMHVGPIVGAIQGTSRLCFDVFGDTVNVASRTMTGSAKIHQLTSTNSEGENCESHSSFCAVSEECRRILLLAATAGAESGEEEEGAADERRRCPFTFHEAQVSAKGKGDLKVFFVSSGPSGKEGEAL
jgi:class 3 adenylate cyclase